ncbi:unnamed protein product [Prorocentrum cordatum]|uniref:Protein-serine/threonine kinase n=1 Tax=Prorocentrum cordatum TaxID=2364126 RepID=A0ABN9XM66_9DINO|nr:unnamed protein product [Polarella glacialis]
MQGPGDLVDEASRQDYIQHEVARFVPMLPHPLSMQDFLDMLEPARLAKFLHEEVLVRSAERIRWIQDVEGWEEIEELRAVRAQHLDGFRALRLVRRVPTLDAFSEVVRSMMDSLQDVPQDLTRAMRRLNLLRGDKYGSDFTDKWLDDFFLSYIGTQMLMAQYLACWEAQCSSTGAGTHRRSTGIIDPDCEPARVCSDAATEIQAICKSLTGRRPVYTLEVHSAAGDDRGGSPRFSFVPGFLKVIVMEILKTVSAPLQRL